MQSPNQTSSPVHSPDNPLVLVKPFQTLHAVRVAHVARLLRSTHRILERESCANLRGEARPAAATYDEETVVDP
jgi:hypothetical protein